MKDFIPQGKRFEQQLSLGSIHIAEVNRLDKGLEGYKGYCALGTVATNLHKLSNVLKEKAQEQQSSIRKVET